MNTALATRTTGSSLAAAPERNAFEQYSEAVNRNRIVGDLLKFNKGDWLVGKDSDEIDVGTQLVAAMDELMVGWVKWEDGKPADMQMGRVIDAYKPLSRKELGDTDEDEWEQDDQGRPRDPWQLTNYLILKEVNGDQLYTFAVSSKGGINAIGALSGAYGKAMRQKPNDFPVVELGVDSYTHPNKAYGRVKVPLLTIKGWTAKAPVLAALAGEAAEAERAEVDDRQDDLPIEAPAAKSKKAGATAESTRF